MKFTRHFLVLLGVLHLLCLTACQTPSSSYAPAPRHAIVQTVEVTVSDFHGRPDIFATIRGRLSGNAAQLVDVEQSRSGNVIYFSVHEQTPRGVTSTNKLPSPPFQTRVPVDALGLIPGQVYLVDANGVRSEFRMPGGPPQPMYTGLSATTGLELPSY